MIYATTNTKNLRFVGKRKACKVHGIGVEVNFEDDFSLAFSECVCVLVVRLNETVRQAACVRPENNRSGFRRLSRGIASLISNLGVCVCECMYIYICLQTNIQTMLCSCALATLHIRIEDST